MSVCLRVVLMGLIAFAMLFAVPVVGQAQDVSTAADTQTAGDTLQIWARQQNKSISEQALLDALIDARLIILGEVHDNSEHHALRARLVSKLIARRAKADQNARPTAAVFEHATTDLQKNFDALNKQGEGEPADAARVATFFNAANWKKRGWPDSKIFAPLIKVVLSAGMPVYAGDVPRALIMSAARGSSTASNNDLVTKEDQTRLKLNQPLGPENDRASLKEIKDVHCGVLPDAMLAPMAEAQRLRDATLADVFLKAADMHGSAILFSGNGHARTDRGVPWYIRARQSGPVISVMFKERPVEVQNEREPNASAPPKSSEDTGPDADFVVWTALRQRPDPCLKMREKYGKTKR